MVHAKWIRSLTLSVKVRVRRDGTPVVTLQRFLMEACILEELWALPSEDSMDFEEYQHERVKIVQTVDRAK